MQQSLEEFTVVKQGNLTHIFAKGKAGEMKNQKLKTKKELRAAGLLVPVCGFCYFVPWHDSNAWRTA
jgi:hypothetical protein